jgi:hypothetical protein
MRRFRALASLFLRCHYYRAKDFGKYKFLIEYASHSTDLRFHSTACGCIRLMVVYPVQFYGGNGKILVLCFLKARLNIIWSIELTIHFSYGSGNILDELELSF